MKAKNFLFGVAWFTNHVFDVVIMGTPTCLLCFFLDFFTIPVSLFLDSTCFPAGSFRPFGEETDVTVAPCLA